MPLLSLWWLDAKLLQIAIHGLTGDAQPAGGCTGVASGLGKRILYEETHYLVNNLMKCSAGVQTDGQGRLPARTSGERSVQSQRTGL